MTGSGLNRRLLLGGLATGVAGGALIGRSGSVLAQAPAAAPAAPPPPPAFTLPPLGYPYEALEPFIDTATMRIHHSAHHNAFIGNLNTLAGQWDGLKAANTEAILRDPSQIPDAQRGGVRNNLGGHWNHAFFWDIMMPGGAKAPPAALKAAIEGAFGSVSNMVQAFNAQGMGRFGSGWAWLVVDKDGKLGVMNTPYQDTPLETGAKAVVIGCDVWEHAYYLKHQNRRADYLRNWWSTVNWDKAAANFAKA
jgi:Fe-Mn family superoxide dismutase